MAAKKTALDGEISDAQRAALAANCPAISPERSAYYAKWEIEQTAFVNAPTASTATATAAALAKARAAATAKAKIAWF